MEDAKSGVSRVSAIRCKVCSFDYLPIKRSFKGYTSKKAYEDLKAGVNVALLAFPQSMAYAVIAGLPIFYGLFTEIIAGIVSPIFSGSRFLIAGATNATAILFFATIISLDLPPDQVLVVVPLILLLVGLFIVIGSIIGIANLIQFVSRSVITGYITAAAIYIIVNQASKVLGVHIEIAKGFTLFGLAWKTICAIPQAHPPTLILSAITAAAYWLMHKYMRGWPNVAIALVLMSALGALFNYSIENSYLGESWGLISHLDGVSVSSWKLHIPQISIDEIRMVAQAALVLAFLCALEAASVGKSVAARAGEKFDVGTELMGVGMANVASAFCGGMPVSGSPVRSQLSWLSGAHTALAPIVSGVFVTIAVFFIGPFIRFIPTCALGTLIVCIGFTLINRHVIRIVMKSTKSDAIVFAVTFLAALIVRLDFAIILGTVTSIALFLRKAAVPQLVEYGADESGALSPITTPKEKSAEQTIVIMHVEGDLFFGAAELFRDQMRRICEDKDLKIIILKLRNARNLDATSIMALEELVGYMRENGRTLLVSEARAETLKIFERSGLADVVGRENIFPDDPSNSTMPTVRALRRAKELMNTRNARISIVLGVQKRIDKETK